MTQMNRRIWHKLLLATLAWAISLTFDGCTGNNAKKDQSAIYRGTNISPFIEKKDLVDLKAFGADIVRLSFPSQPFAELEEPFKFREEAFEDLNKIIDWCEELELKVIIDPHRFPGTSHPWTMLGSDDFWKDLQYHEQAIRIWKEIATRCHRYGAVIGGYDLLNEPQINAEFKENTAEDLNFLYHRLVREIRKIDTIHTIILACPRVLKDGRMLSYHYGAPYLDLPDDDNLWIETHVYNPHAFSHQGVNNPIDSIVPYPGMIDGIYWDKLALEASMKEVLHFSKKHDIHVLVGEFSAPRWIGESGNQYIKDIISICEANSWSWTYHAFRESHIWDMEMSNTDKSDKTRYDSTPRLELLKAAFQGKLSD